MNFAHMIGEHSSDRSASWAIFGLSVVLAVVLGYVIYKRTRKNHAKEEINRK